MGDAMVPFRPRVLAALAVTALIALSAAVPAVADLLVTTFQLTGSGAAQEELVAAPADDPADAPSDDPGAASPLALMDGSELEDEAADDGPGASSTADGDQLDEPQGTAQPGTSTEVAGDGLTVRVFQRSDGSVRLVFVGYESVILDWPTPSEALRSMTVDRYPQYILGYWHGVPYEVSDPLVEAAAVTVRGYREPTTAGTEGDGQTGGGTAQPPASRTVELPPSGSQLATVRVSQGGDGAVQLVFVGYEDVALTWIAPAEALISMTVHRYPQRILFERHGVPVEVSDPLVQAAADEVRTFFDPSAGGSLRIREAVVDGRTIRVLFSAGTIDVIFLGGWEDAAFYGYDSVGWALGDLVDGGYVERIITSRFGASVEQVRPALAAARELVSAG